MRHLARHESLEEKRAELAIRLGRPVWVASCQRKSGTLYRYPGMESYVKVRESELWLSRLWDRGRCVKREPQEGGDHFYFDLEPAPFLYLVAPVLTGEEVSFREVGLNPGLPSSRTLDWDDACPLRLAPFRVQARQTRGRRLKDVVRFACSEPVASPDVRQDTWLNDFAKKCRAQPLGPMVRMDKYAEKRVAAMPDSEGFADGPPHGDPVFLSQGSSDENGRTRSTFSLIQDFVQVGIRLCVGEST